MDSKIPVRLRYPEMTLSERGPSSCLIFPTCDVCLHALLLSLHICELVSRDFNVWTVHGVYFTLGHQETQTELVMFILLRLAEDVVTFQTLPTQRRRDIQQTLTQNMEKIFSFLLTALQQNVSKYRRMVRVSFPWV